MWSRGTCAASDLFGTVGRPPDDQSYPARTTTFSLLFGLTSSGSFQTLQTVDQLADQVDEHGKENKVNQ